jgi:hypothetical protein
MWGNCRVPRRTRERREQLVNVVLILGVILWSFPLAAIQVFAKANNLAQIPGMEWIETFRGGALLGLVNGYLPVRSFSYTVDCIRIACRSLACPLTCLLFESSRFLSPPFCAGRGFAHSDHDLASNIRIRRCAR